MSLSEMSARIYYRNQVEKLKNEIGEILSKNQKKLDELINMQKKSEVDINEKLRIIEDIVAKATKPKKKKHLETSKCESLLGAVRELDIPEAIKEQHIGWCMQEILIIDAERKYSLDGIDYILTNKSNDENSQFWLEATVIE